MVAQAVQGVGRDHLQPQAVRPDRGDLQGADTSGLDAQQKRLVTRTYDSFVRQGAKLTPAQKEELSAFNQNLAINFSEFSQRLLADEGTAIIVTDEARLAGLPDSVKAVAQSGRRPSAGSRAGRSSTPARRSIRC